MLTCVKLQHKSFFFIIIKEIYCISGNVLFFFFWLAHIVTIVLYLFINLFFVFHEKKYEGEQIMTDLGAKH